MSALAQHRRLAGPQSQHQHAQLPSLASRRCRCQASSSSSASGPSTSRPKGWDRPWVVSPSANAPAMPRNAGDPFGILFSQRTIFLGGEVEDVSADALVSQILLLDNQEQGKDIKMFINSPGGSVTAGLGIYDSMMLCRSDISTYCFGLAASMGAFLLGAGKKGKRYAMPNARIMIHQPLGGAQGQAVDIEISAKEIMYHKSNLNRIIANYTGQPLSRVEQDTDRDNYLSPIEARDYGIIDHIIGGEEEVYKVKGSMRKFPKVKEEFIHDMDDLVRRNIMDGDPFHGPTPSWRFKSRETEPYMPSQSPGNPWFKVKRISKEEYKELLELNRPETADGSDSGQRSPKERIDSAW